MLSCIPFSAPPWQAVLSDPPGGVLLFALVPTYSTSFHFWSFFIFPRPFFRTPLVLWSICGMLISHKYQLAQYFYYTRGVLLCGNLFCLPLFCCLLRSLGLRFCPGAKPAAAKKASATKAPAATQKPAAAPKPTPKATPKPSREESATVYWTASGGKYHISRNCATLKRSKTIKSGTIAQAGNRGQCKVCG